MLSFSVSSSPAARLSSSLLLSLVVFPALFLTAAPSLLAQDSAASRLFREAESHRDAGAVDAALDSYLLLVRQFPDDERASAALLAAAELYETIEQNRAAADTVERLLAEYPRSREAASGFVLRGELEVEAATDARALAAARTKFRRVPLLFGTDDFPDLEARVRARIRSAEIGLALGDANGAALELIPAIDDEPPSRLTGRARLVLGRALLATGDLRAALDELQRLAAEGDESGSDATGNPLLPRLDTSTPEDRSAARRLVSLVHRQRLRPLAGEPRWRRTSRFPETGLALREPTGVAAAEDGRVLIVDDDESASLVEADGTITGTRPVEDAVRPDFSTGAAVVVAEGRVTLPFDGQSMTFLEPQGGRERPLDRLRAAVRGPHGDWFLADGDWDGLLVYSSPRQGREVLATLRLDLVDVDLDTLGRPVALDAEAGRVFRLAKDQRTQEILARDDWRRPAALALDGLGHVYVLDRGQRQIFVYSPDGARVAVLGPDLGGGIELRDPRDVAVDGSGRLYVADADLPFLVRLD